MKSLAENIGENRRFRLVYLRTSAAISKWDGEPEEAIESLREASSLAESMELPGELWQIRVELGDAYRTSDRKERTVEEYAKAKGVVSSIAARIEDEGMRERFLASPKARRVMGRSESTSGGGIRVMDSRLRRRESRGKRIPPPKRAADDTESG